MVDHIEVFKQNSIRIRSGLGNIYVDPFRMDESPRDAAFVFITHDHYDHFSPEDIERVICERTILVVPEKMAGKAGELAGSVAEIVTVNPGEQREIGGLAVETVPMYNILKPFHPRSAGWVGYVLTVDGKRIYIAGDIDAIPEARDLKCDIAMVPIGGFYTMDTKKAAELINAMQPAVAIPVHYGDVVGKPGDGQEFAKLVKPPVEVVVKI